MQQLSNVVVYVGLNFIHVIFFLVLGMVKYNNDILTKHKIARQFKYIMANKLTIYSVVDDTDHTKDAFQKSKLASQTLAGPVISHFDLNETGFFQRVFAENPSSSYVLFRT